MTNMTNMTNNGNNSIMNMSSTRGINTTINFIKSILIIIFYSAKKDY